MFGLDSDQFGFVLYAFGLALVGWLGGSKGKEFLTAKPVKTAQADTAQNLVEVAGAIVSDKMAAEWVRAAEELTRGIKENTRACDAMAGRIDKVGEVMHDLAKEMEIASRMK